MSTAFNTRRGMLPQERITFEICLLNLLPVKLHHVVAFTLVAGNHYFGQRYSRLQYSSFCPITVITVLMIVL